MKGLYFLLILTILTGYGYSQTYTPITVTGFTQDPIAESGTNAVAVTSAVVVDGSNHIMYNNAFRITNAMAGGGLPDNGLIVTGTRTFQLAPYTGNNALYVKRAETRALTLSTNASYSAISILWFSTEGPSLLNVSLGFSDGSSTTYLTNYSLPDWFNGTTNIALQGFGRFGRAAAGPYVPDAYPTNPRFYYVDISLNCTDRIKLLQTVTFANITTAGTNAPYPNTIPLAVSGATFQQTVTPSSTASTCTAGGTASVVVTGNTGPYTYSWNTTPVQTTATATNLQPGTYTVTITDASSCTRTATVVVTGIVAPPAPTSSGVSVCNGATATLQVINPVTGYTYNWYTVATGGTAVGTGTSFTVSNVTTTTTYYLEAVSGGCSSARTPVVITAQPVVATPSATGGTICAGSAGNFTVTNPITGVTYNWYNAATAGTLVGTGAILSIPAVNTTTTYYVEAVSNGCTSTARGSATVTVLPILAAPVVTLTSATSTSLTFSWTAVPGATGYQVSTDGTTFQNPSSGATGTTHTITGLTPLTTITLIVRALGTLGCQTSANGTAKGETVTKEIFVPNAFTPNGDGKNDVLLVYGNSIASLDFIIFDQWGELIFETTNQSKGWDGSYKGKPQPVGVYVYVLKATRTDGSAITKKGSINLIR